MWFFCKSNALHLPNTSKLTIAMIEWKEITRVLATYPHPFSSKNLKSEAIKINAKGRSDHLFQLEIVVAVLSLIKVCNHNVITIPYSEHGSELRKREGPAFF